MIKSYKAFGQPVFYQPMFAAHGKAKNETCLTFVSQAAVDENVKEKYGLEKTVVSVIYNKAWFGSGRLFDFFL